MKQKKKLTILSLLLCMALLLGPVRPLQIYASLLDDEDDFSDADTDDAPADEPSQSQSSGGGRSSSGNSEVDAMYNQIDQINEQLDNIEAENKKLEQSISEAQTVRDKELAEKSVLDAQIYNTRSEISLLKERIELLEEEIVIKQEEIEDKQEEYDANFDVFLQRLRIMYMYDDATTLGLIFGADDFVDFLTRTETMVRIADHDNQLMQQLTEERENLEQDQQELLEIKESVEEDRQRTEEKEIDLANKVSSITKKVQQLNELEEAFRADLASNKAKAEAMEANIQSLMEKIKWSTNPYAGGSMLWPVNGFYQISSGYGPRFGGSDYHTGVDISGSGIYGANILAANDGTVVIANWSYTPGQGYGIYVMLDHGGGIGTLYGHCSNLYVSVGQEVKKGDPIAQIGSTGWSTGPHLHFEVRVNGSHVNPMSYLQG